MKGRTKRSPFVKEREAKMMGNVTLLDQGPNFVIFSLHYAVDGFWLREEQETLVEGKEETQDGMGRMLN